MNLARIFHQLSALLAFLILYAHHGTGNSKSERAPGERKVRLDREGIARTRTGVPRWPAAVALLSVGVSYIALSGYVTFGPRAWLPGLMAVLVVPLLVAHARGHYRLARGIGFVLLVVTTASVILRVFFLVSTISVRGASASSVLVDAILIWVSTVLTFAVWYWEIDGGGPAERRTDVHASEDFLFPQIDMQDGKRAVGWAPGFLDYLFLAFNTSAAFSPTDTPVLSRRAKVLTMVQSVLSLIVIVVLVGWALDVL